MLNYWQVKDTLDSLLKQTILPDEVIVADGGSEESLISMLKEYEQKNDIIKLYNIPGSIAESRNKTIPLVKGDIIVFLDADEVAPKGWLEKLIKPIIEEEADFVGGKTIARYPPKNRVEKYVYDMTEWRYKHAYKYDVSRIHMGNSAWKKEIFDKIGNFDERIKWGGEDYDINIRAIKAGFKGVFLDEAWVWHDRGIDTLWKFIRKNYKYSIGTTVTYLKNGVLGEKKYALKAEYKSPLEYVFLIIKSLAFIRGYIEWSKIRKS